nr:immunoglobulin heavy chain junction region [Macaca mulatta]
CARDSSRIVAAWGGFDSW